MRILICNDDGIDAPGLTALYRACRPFGDVAVVAPTTERSSCSHAVNLGPPITVQTRAHELYGSCHAVDGTPADCVRLALSGLLAEPADLVVSGINRGANVGVDTYYSGTVAAAREAAILGRHAVAVSQYVRRHVPDDWERATALTHHVLTALLDRFPDTGTRGPDAFWNVNLPLPAADGTAVACRVVPHSVDPMPMVFTTDASAGDDEARYQYAGQYADRKADPDTDVAAVFGGDVAITCIRLAATAESVPALAVGPFTPG